MKTKLCWLILLALMVTWFGPYGVRAQPPLASPVNAGGSGGGGGTVSSVGLSLPNIFTVSGSPVTTSGTLTGTLASQTQNLVFASPNGSSGTPSFRALVNADLASPSTTVNGQTCTLGSSCTVGAAPTGTAGGDLSGSYPNPTVVKINGTAFSGVNGDLVSFGASNIPADSGIASSNVAQLGSNTFTGVQTFSKNGALSTPSIVMSGTWISGGTGTTTTPQVFITDGSLTAPTAWNTNGTGWGMECPNGSPDAFTVITGNVPASKQVQITCGGSITVTGSIVAGTNMVAGPGTSAWRIGWNSTSFFANPVDGIIALNNNAGTGFTRLDIGPNGSTSYIGIGVTSQVNPIMNVLDANGGTTAQLQVAGTRATGTGDVSVCWTTTGIFTEGAVCGTSLLAYKDHVEPLSDALSSVMKLQPVSFNWIATGQPDIGLIADWTAAVNPLLGAYDSEGKLYNFRDRAVLAVLIKAVQEEQIEIEALKPR